MSFVESNWRAASGEIDLVMVDEDFLVMVEVKVRRGERAGSAEEAISTVRAGDCWPPENGMWQSIQHLRRRPGESIWSRSRSIPLARFCATGISGTRWFRARFDRSYDWCMVSRPISRTLEIGDQCRYSKRRSGGLRRSFVRLSGSIAGANVAAADIDRALSGNFRGAWL